MMKTENVTFCTECGNKNSKINSFCLNCGNELIQEKLEYKNSNTNTGTTISLNKPINKIDNSSDYLNTDEINLFISKNIEYYHEKFNQITKTGNKRTWNWAAFLCNGCWLLYRKMYIQWGILVLISSIMGVIASVIPILGPILSIGVYIVFAMYANSIYLDHINRKLNEINCMEYELKESMIRKKGGTNIVLAIVVGCIGFVVSFIIGFFTTFLATSTLFY